MKKTLASPNLWFALLLLLANGAAWARALSPQDPAMVVQPRLEPDLAALRDRLIEGDHSGESFRIEVTDQEAAEHLISDEGTVGHAGAVLFIWRQTQELAGQAVEIRAGSTGGHAVLEVATDRVVAVLVADDLGGIEGQRLLQQRFGQGWKCCENPIPKRCSGLGG